MTLARDEWLSEKLRYVVVSIGGIDTQLDHHRHHHHRRRPHSPSLPPELSKTTAICDCSRVLILNWMISDYEFYFTAQHNAEYNTI